MTTATTTAAGSAPQPYPPLPASPTLTNPDMILPDYDRASSPLELDADRSQSPLMMWKNAHAATSSTELHQLYTVSGSAHPFGNGPITPTTPIIYGNGTMLSDIGEVTEVESTPGKPSPGRRRDASPADDALRSSPTMGLEAVKKALQRQRSRDRARRSSLDSNSTITTQDQSALFADFDDSVSVGDSVFQGDDEESVAESYVSDEGTRPLRAPQGLMDHNAQEYGRPAAEGRTSMTSSADRQSAILLSQRAEKILANAKRRLTTMEGNLSRARSSLHTSSPSISSLGSGGTSPSPTLPFRSPAFSPEAGEVAPAPGHTRMGSDNTLRIGLPVKVYPQRSASALGVAGGYRQPLTSSRSVDQIREGARNAASLRSSQKPASGPRDSPLEPLSESEGDSPRPRVSGDLAPSSSRSGAHVLGFLSPTFGPEHDDAKVVTRSASVNQMRDLRDQVKDLKGKISSLRDQARADSLRRRSFQSLRTPSPFTHARVEQWYAEPNARGSPSPPAEDVCDPKLLQKPIWNGEPCSVSDGGGGVAMPEEGLETSADGDSHAVLETPEPRAVESIPPDTTRRASTEGNNDNDDDDDVSDMLTEDGDYLDEQYDTAETPGYESESGESAYHDTLQHPISHEDREDAFDYEHFILHSALGTISQQRLARGDRSGSFSSEDSVETTRGPVANSESYPGTADGLELRRSDSVSSNWTSASVESFESFATADEGRRSRQDGQRNGSEDRARGYGRLGELARGSGRQSVIPPATDDDQLGSDGSADGSGGDTGHRRSPPAATVHRRPASSAATSTLHRPSVSSFESTGTVRSFPLVTRKKAASFTLSGTGTGHRSSSPNGDLQAISDSLMNDAAAAYTQQASASCEPEWSSPAKGSGSVLAKSNTAAMQKLLLREDQFLVERLVAGIGRCILGLGEGNRGSAESRMYRRRLDAARRILEGIDAV